MELSSLHPLSVLLRTLLRGNSEGVPMLISLITSVVGLLQGYFLLDVIKLTRGVSRRIGGKTIRELMDTGRPAQGVGEIILDFSIMIVSLTLAFAVILGVPGFIWASVLRILDVAVELRQFQSKIWALAFLFGLFVVRVLITKIRKHEF